MLVWDVICLNVLALLNLNLLTVVNNSHTLQIEKTNQETPMT